MFFSERLRVRALKLRNCENVNKTTVLCFGFRKKGEIFVSNFNDEKGGLICTEPSIELGYGEVVSILKSWPDQII
jgi:hypothetical protein